MEYNRLTKIERKQKAQAALVNLTDNTTGTVSNTVPALSGTPTAAELRNALASITAKVNALINASKTV